MKTLKVYCSYHNENGTCTEEDYNDAKERRNPSRMVRVNFATFTHAVPFITLTIIEDKHNFKLNGDMANEFNDMQEDEWMQNEMDYMY